MSNEEKLKNGFLSLLSANAYITANSISGVIAGDASHTLEARQFAVDLAVYEEEIPNTPFRRAVVKITAGTIVSKDKNRAIVNEIYENIYNTIKTITKEQLTAASGLSIDAIQEFGGGQTNIDDNMHTSTCQCTIFLQET